MMTLINKAYKTKLRLTPKQKRYFNGCVGAARFVFNWALADRKQIFEAGGKPNKFEQKRRFNSIKDNVCSWIREYPYTLLDSEFDHVDKAYKNFFRRIKQGKGGKEAGFPKFKSRKNKKQSFTLRGAILIENGKIRLPRIGWVTLSEKSYFPENNVKINSATITSYANKWYVSVQVEEDIIIPETNDHVIGVDVGIKSSAVLSDGRSFDAPKTLYRYEKKLAKLNRELSRRKQGSSNWKKTAKKLTTLYKKIVDVRNHFQHNVSCAVVSDLPNTIVIEDLNVKGMVKNRRLAKAVSDASMSELHRQIEYKAGWNGIELVKADRWFPSSKTCSECGWINSELKLSDRLFVCQECGIILDRDLNAAINLAHYVEPVKRGELPVELLSLDDTVKQEGSDFECETSSTYTAMYMYTY